MSAPNSLFAYLSPETVVPVASIVAAGVGGLMFLTRGSFRFLVRCARGALPRPHRLARAQAGRRHAAHPTHSEKARD
jgi:hypothetical protein